VKHGGTARRRRQERDSGKASEAITHFSQMLSWVRGDSKFQLPNGGEVPIVGLPPLLALGLAGLGALRARFGRH